MAGLRVAELERLFVSRFGIELPYDDAGRDDLVLIAHHIGRRAGEPGRRIATWCRTHAPWITAAELEQLVDDVRTKPRRWRADTLAERVNLTEAERSRLKITTIGAVDVTKAERTAARLARARETKAQKRRAAGAMPRAIPRAIHRASETVEGSRPQSANMVPAGQAHTSRIEWQRVRHST